MEETKNPPVPVEKPELMVPSKIRLGYSDVHFRGVFATADIGEGELIERCPVVALAWRTNYQKDPVVWAYMYTNSCPCDECKRHGAHFVMVMGWGQIYNHQDDNNAVIKIDMRLQIADIVAKKKILKGEEIFVSYGDKYFQNRPKIDLSKDGSTPKDFIESGDFQQQSKVIRPL